MSKHQRSSSAPCTSINRQDFATKTPAPSIDDERSTVVDESGQLRRSASNASTKKIKYHSMAGFPLATVETDLESCYHNSSESPTVVDSPVEPYSVFSKCKIRWIVLLVSVAAFFAPFSVNSYFPAMGLIEKDFHVSTQQVNLSVTVFMIFQAISPSFWSALADTRGRRPVYICTLLVYVVACIGLAVTSSYISLLLLRMLQAFGASSVIAIGAGTIADVVHPAKRGGYLGYYSLGWNLGPVVGPAIGGVVSQYLGWRWIFWLLAIFGAVHWLLLGFCLPETLRSLVGNGSGYANPTPLQWWRHRQQEQARNNDEPVEKNKDVSEKASLSSFTQWLLSLFQSLTYAKEMDILMLLILYMVQYAAFYTVTTSLPYLFTSIYNLNETMVGLSYFPSGVGCIAGSVIQGKILNRDYKKMQARFLTSEKSCSTSTLDLPLEHARLRTVWIHAIVFNILLVVYGWCLYLKVHISAILVIHFVLGFSTQAIFNAIQTLFVDLYPTKSASITATNNIFRCLAGAGATTAIIPGINLLGIGWVFTLSSGILLISRVPLVLELMYGPRWRRCRTEREAH